MMCITQLFVHTGGYLKEFTDEESNFAALLQRAMDLEGVDRETVHQLVALLMKVSSYFIHTCLKSLLFLAVNM